jgi:hypothetical protein
VPLAPPTTLAIALLVRPDARPPAVDRLLDVAADIACELDWLPAGHAATD